MYSCINEGFLLFMAQGTKKVRALNLTKSQERQFGAKNFAKMPNLHFLVLNGCDVGGNFGNIFK